MTQPKWPQVESAEDHKVYPLSRFHPLARPRLGDDPVPVDRVTEEQARKPRRCFGKDEDLAGIGKSAVYWCRSCNRRVPNGRTPFCRAHQKQRHDYSLDLRREEARREKRITVTPEELADLHRAANALKGRLATFKNAHEERKGVALRGLIQAVEAFTHQVDQSLPPEKATVRKRELVDPWT